MEKYTYNNEVVTINGNIVNMPYTIKSIVDFAKSRKYIRNIGFELDDVDLAQLKSNLQVNKDKDELRKEFVSELTDEHIETITIVEQLRNMQMRYTPSSKMKKEFESLQSRLKELASNTTSEIINKAMIANYNRPDRDVIQFKNRNDLIDSMM